MEYCYYQEVKLQEHMLFAKEIGELYGISSQKVASSIESYCKENNIVIPKLFYKTKYGLARVYSKDVWAPALEKK